MFKLNEDQKATIFIISFILLAILLLGCAIYTINNISDSYGTVDYVIDGDTIVLTNGEHVRYIGMDTPEKGDCYYAEATKRNELLVDGKNIRIFKDKTNKDKYGRLLRYVYVGDREVNSTLVEEGYAETFAVWPNNAQEDKFDELQDKAKALKKGMWGDCKSNIN